MANYCCATRTNYFHVKDPVAFKEFMNRVCADEDAVDVWEEKDENGDTVFGFGCYGSILGVEPDGVENNEDFDYDYEEFIQGLSECVADDDAVIVMESGNEKLRYLVGSALIVTSTDNDYYEIEAVAAKRASEMLNNPSWKTRTNY